ncbi:MAG: hypothetical protein IPK42_24800 [Betaproteobacteria bacterium]|nr:hypothetical protein [Betaproteobacteria bacterium]
MTYEEILAYLESLKGTPVDLEAQMHGHPRNEVNSGRAAARMSRGATCWGWNSSYQL